MELSLGRRSKWLGIDILRVEGQTLPPIYCLRRQMLAALRKILSARDGKTSADQHNRNADQVARSAQQDGQISSECAVLEVVKVTSKLPTDAVQIGIRWKLELRQARHSGSPAQSLEIAGNLTLQFRDKLRPFRAWAH